MEGHQDDWRWTIYPMRRHWGTKACSPWRRDGCGGPNSSPQCLGGCQKGDGDRFFPAGCGWKWEAKEDIWNKSGSDSTQAFLPWEQSGSGAGYPEGLCHLHPWRFWRPSWKKPWATLSDLRVDPALSRTFQGPFQPELSSDSLIQLY